jgi:pimeloyl-ACP methyl ester carboxylesterase
MLRGGSTGGWEALALHLQHPDFFGGSWPMCPDPVDFRRFITVDIYKDSNAFVLAEDNQLQSPVGEWLQPERFFSRGPDGQPFLTMRQQAQREEALGTRGRSGEQFGAWDAAFGPVGPDGYPVPLFDKHTGQIDRDVANYWRDNGYDLRAYLEKNWTTLAPKIDGKIHLDVGDMDNYFLNLAVYDLQALFDSATNPPAKAKFYYGRPMKGHGWQHTSTAGILREMAAHITANAAPGEDTSSWKY